MSECDHYYKFHPGCPGCEEEKSAVAGLERKNKTMNRPIESDKPPAAGSCPAPGTTLLTPGPWRYQKETTLTILGRNYPPQVRYEIYKDGGIYGHPATCNREEDAQAIAMLPEIIEALRPFAHYACNPKEGPCHCHNCHARFVLAKALGPDWQSGVTIATQTKGEE